MKKAVADKAWQPFHHPIKGDSPMKRITALIAAFLLLAGLVGCSRSEKDSPFEFTVTDGQAELTRYTGSAEEVEIPASFEGSPVTSIGARALYNCIHVKKVILPKSVETIGQEAFALCPALTDFQVDEKNNAFIVQDGILFSKDMTTLVACPEGKSGEYTLPSGVKSIGEQAFSRCLKLTKITLPDGLTTIGAAAFYNCTKLTSLSIPDTVTSIGATAFCRCAALSSVTLPKGLTKLETGLFSDCTSLKSLDIPDSLTEIGQAVFWDCPSLVSFTAGEDNASFKTIDGVLLSKDGSCLIRYPAGKTGDTYTLPATVTTLHSEAFSYNTQLKRIDLPGRLKTVPESAFYQCPGLEKVTMGEGITSIGDKAFGTCKALEVLNLPSTLKTIGEGAFNNCDALKTTLLPAGLKTIGSEAFSYCDALETITIPDGVTEIGTTAFGGCENLRLYATPGSEAEAYAGREDIPFNDNDKTSTTNAP